MRRAPCITIPRNNGACCSMARPSGFRAGRKFRSGRAISGARREMCRTRCGLDRTAPACLTSSARRGPSTKRPGPASASSKSANKNKKSAATFGRRHLVKITRRNLLAASAAFAVTPALAQPAKNMTLVVPFPPGGSTDALARLLQSHLQTKLGRTVLVENKSGAAGSLGAIQVAKSAPDGATFLVTFDSHAVIPAILEKPGLDVEKDLLPVFLVGTAPYVLAANAERPYKNFADVIAASKANPGVVKYASVGIGTLGHLAMTVLGKKVSVEITHVPYRGGGPAMNDVLGGHVDMIIGSAALITGQLGTKMLRPILQMGRERMPVLKDTQTAIEAGYPDFETLAWWGVFAPKDTPSDIVASMAKSVKEILSEPAVATQLQETQQMTLLLADGKAFSTFFAKQVSIWGQVVRENNIKA